MKKSTLIGLGLGAAVALVATYASEAAAQKKAAKCANVGGQGTGFVEAIAKDQALWAFADALAKDGGKASGKQSVKCSGGLGNYTCTASQKVCK